MSSAMAAHYKQISSHSYHNYGKVGEYPPLYPTLPKFNPPPKDGYIIHIVSGKKSDGMGPEICFTHYLDNYGALFTSHNSQSAVLYSKGRSAPLNPNQIKFIKANFNSDFDGYSGRDYDISSRIEKLLSVYDKREATLKEAEPAQVELKAAKTELASMQSLLHAKTEELKVTRAELTEAHAVAIFFLKVEHSAEIAELNSRVRTTAELLESMSSELARLQLCEEELIRLKQIEARQLREAAFEREMVERRVGVWKNSTTTNTTNTTNATNATNTTNATATTVEAHDDPK